MDKADVGGRIVDFLDSLIGHFKGGLLQVMVVGVYLSSCISGSKAADMATIGIPMNRKLDAHGYEPHERAALLAAAAAMAESVPPSIALILLGSSTCDLHRRAVHRRHPARGDGRHLPHDPRAHPRDALGMEALAARERRDRSRATAGARSCRS